MTLVGLANAADGATRCDLPAQFGVAVEERSVTEEGGPGLVATTQRPGSQLVAGDIIRQANATRVTRCRELESAAAQALATGVVLLLAVERQGGFTAVAAMTDGASAVTTRGEGPRVPPATGPVGAGAARAIETGAAPGPVARAPVPSPTPLPAPPRVVELPACDAIAPTIRESAARAARTLAGLESVATPSVPVAVYGRRIDEATTILDGLPFDEGKGGAEVRAFVREVLGYHRTAVEVERFRIETASERGADPRGAMAGTMPYFSDSRVPEWVARYPFLRESLVEAPRATRMLLPGEIAGSWNPTRALELLWEHAHAATERLDEWCTGR